MDKRRLKAEQEVLATHLPENIFRFFDLGTPRERLVMGMRTNRGNVYSVSIRLSGFPTHRPKVFVTRMLHDKKGNALDSCSFAMHTLDAENGWTQICHYGVDSWTPRVSLFKVYVKCRLWLEMYELHLQTGKPIDYYLNHQD